MLTFPSKRIENSIKEITEKSETKKMEVSWAKFSILAPRESAVLTCLADHADPGGNATAAAAGSRRRVRSKHHTSLTRSLNKKMLLPSVMAFEEAMHAKTNTAATRAVQTICVLKSFQRADLRSVSSASQVRYVARADDKNKTSAVHANTGGKLSCSKKINDKHQFSQRSFLLSETGELLSKILASPMIET